MSLSVAYGGDPRKLLRDRGTILANYVRVLLDECRFAFKMFTSKSLDTTDECCIFRLNHDDHLLYPLIPYLGRGSGVGIGMPEKARRCK